MSSEEAESEESSCESTYDDESRMSNVREGESTGVVITGESKLRRVIYCLSISIFLTISLIFFFTFLVIYLLSQVFRMKDESMEMSLYQYPFFHTDDGKISFQGQVTLPNTLDQPFVSFTSLNESHDVMLIFGWGKEKFEHFYEVLFHLYCCPIDLFTQERRNFALCRNIRKNIVVSMPGHSKDYIREELIKRVTDNKEVEHCLDGEILFEDIEGIIEIDPYYDCYGYCRGNTYQRFLDKNPTLIKDIRYVLEGITGDDYTDKGVEKEYVKPLFDVESKKCEKFKMEGKYVKEKQMSHKNFMELYRNLLLAFCAENKYISSEVLKNKKYYGVCRISKDYSCKVHDMTLYETLSVGDYNEEENEKNKWTTTQP